MMFKVHARSVVALKERRAVPVVAEIALKNRIEAKRAELQSSREVICKGCRFWMEEIGRCMHHKCGCPRSQTRLRPWAVLQRCPDGRW